MFIMKKSNLLLTFLLSLTVCYSQERTDSVYIYCYFKGNGEDGLHLAYSKDGLPYTALNNDKSYLQPVIAKDRLMRDPCIIRGAGNLFHMVWTVSWNDPGIGYASSADLIHWSEQIYIPVMETKEKDSVLNTLAPEITYDPFSKAYMIYWSSTIKGKLTETKRPESEYNHRMYYTTTKDFKTFSASKLLYDKGFNVIDGTIKVLGKRNYLMFIKDETETPVPEKNIRIAKSKHFTKGYSNASVPITGKFWAEGPTAILVQNKWIVFFDRYTESHYGAVSSTDLFHWTYISS